MGDFTWYLRNLLLLKTGGDGGETLDVSAENLRLLEEESGRVEEQTLMRYIRILSELSNRIRYSTQKRVEVEVALIRMCRPQMEVDTTSLLERVRELEKKLEKGLTAVPAAPVYQRTASRRETSPREEASAPAKATPEDLAQIAARWREITRQCGPLLRALLDTAVPQYNAETGENVLYLSIHTPQGGCGLSGKQIVELQDIIEQTLGKQVEVKELKSQSQAASMRELEVRETVAREVAIPVEIERDIEE